MNDSGKRFVLVNAEVQVAIAQLMSDYPDVLPAEWASHLFLCAAAMAWIGGVSKPEAAGEAQYAIDIAYTTEPPNTHITIN